MLRNFFLTKLNIHLTYGPAILLLGIYPTKIKLYVHKKICIKVFTENYQTGELINKLRYTHTTKVYSAIKRNTPLIYTPIQMDLKNNMLSEKSQKQKSTDCKIPFIQSSRTDITNLCWQIKRVASCLHGVEIIDREQGEQRNYLRWWKCSMSWLGWVVHQNSQNLHLRSAHFTVRKFYLSF